MKATITIKKEVEIKTCLVEAQVRYWEDGTVTNWIKNPSIEDFYRDEE